MFNQKLALKELKNYQNKGPSNTTKILLDQLIPLVDEKKSLLDIGGGIGAISHELSKVGLSKLIYVDASKAYLHTAKAESERLGFGDRNSFYYGDFVEIASQIPPTDLVTLDKVLCCYPDVQSLVARSLEKTKEYYGIVYPRNSWWVRLGSFFLNSIQRVKRSKYRSYIHQQKAIHDIIHSYGFKRIFKQKQWYWIMEVFVKVSNFPPESPVSK
ncbi:MAG: class I SAM-dependent methyltransferase [Candidatus Hodarchaeales archaeon]|jgi:magnesium-protoporphyrin O-methyltransferase